MSSRQNQENGAATLPARLAMPPAVSEHGIDAGKWRVLTEAIYPSAKSAESILLVLDYCRARSLDPFKKPVHIVPVWNSELGREVETIWPGINEVQITATRTGQWAGMDAPQWGPLVTSEFSGKNGKVRVKHHEWCAVTVYKLINGQRCGYCEPVFWLEAYATQGRSDAPNKMWLKRPNGQLLKCAKAASLRAAFPEESGGMPTAEEMEGKEVDAGGIVIEGKVEPQETAPMPERIDEHGEVFESWPVLRGDGAVHGSGSDHKQLLRLYGEAKKASPGLEAQCAARNIDMLRHILPGTANGLRDRLEREIEAAEMVTLDVPHDQDTGEILEPEAAPVPEREIEEVPA